MATRVLEICGVLALSWILYNVLFLIGALAFTKATGIVVTELKIFSGPVTMSGRFLGVAIEIGRLPWPCASIGFYGAFSDDPHDQLAYSNRSRLVRASAHLSGHLIVFGAVILVLGPVHAMASLRSGFQEIVLGAIYPLAYGSRLAKALAQGIFNIQMPYVVGLILIKALSANLLPLAPLSGGNAVLQMLTKGANSRFNGIGLASVGGITLASVGLTMALVLGWIIAIIAAIIT